MTESTSAFTSLAYGTVVIFLFLVPIVIYSSEYAEQEKQGRGYVNGGDIFKIIAQGVRTHIIYAFIIVTLFGLAELIFSAIPSFSPKEGLTNFFSTATVRNSMFIQEWMSDGYGAATSTENNPLVQTSVKVYVYAMKAYGVILTLIFMIIPVVILGYSISFAMGGKEEMRDESGISRVLGAFVLFLGATFLVFFHSIIASSVVYFVTDVESFSFYESMSSIWELILFGKNVNG